VIARFVAYIPTWMWFVIGGLIVGLLIALAWALRERRRRRTADGVAMRDALTDVANVKAFNERLGQAWSHARRHGEAFGVLVIDLDRFKAINDNHGHAAGDAVLVDTAARLKRYTRAGDLVARIGGDEFAVICPNTDLEGLQSLRSQLEKRATAGALEIEVGLSIGIAEMREGDVAPADVVERADVSMYSRKRSRRSASMPARATVAAA
jgi:diguanylate cyclase (GGDEF)-like protein